MSGFSPKYHEWLGVDSILMSKISYFTYCGTVEGPEYSECLGWQRASVQYCSRCQKVSCRNVTYVWLAFPDKSIVTLGAYSLDAQK